jgi:hypothetical protein
MRVIIVVWLGCVKLVIRECGWIVDKSPASLRVPLDMLNQNVPIHLHLREFSTQPLNLMGCILVSIAVWATTIVATRRIPKLFHDIVGHCVS